MSLWTAWHMVALDRSKKLPKLEDLIRKLEPARVMSPRDLRAAIIAAATAMGSSVRHVKREDI